MIVISFSFHVSPRPLFSAARSNCVRDEIRGTHVRLIATRETVCCSRLETCVAHSPRYLGGSRPVKCSINIEIAIPPDFFQILSYPSTNRWTNVRLVTQDLYTGGLHYSFNNGGEFFNEYSFSLIFIKLSLDEEKENWNFYIYSKKCCCC